MAPLGFAHCHDNAVFFTGLEHFERKSKLAKWRVQNSALDRSLFKTRNRYCGIDIEGAFWPQSERERHLKREVYDRRSGFDGVRYGLFCII
jgi:hypothetical protein